MMREQFLKEVAAAGLPVEPPAPQRISEADVAELPESVRRYLGFMRVVGRVRDWSFRVGYVGRFRLGPDRSWLPCEAWQYDSRLGIARLFQIRVRFWGVVPVVARDTYREGHGRMLVKMLDRIRVEDATGPEFDAGELVTYLNDAILFAPSMLLGAETTWSAVDDESFDVSLTDRGRTVAAHVTIDSEGKPSTFSTTDRFVNDPYDAKHALVRARWTTPIRTWETIEGRPVLGAGQALWHLDRGSFAYADLNVVPGSLAHNVRPGA